MTKEEIAKAFSIGKFKETISFLSDNAAWIIVNEKRIDGKNAIIGYCKLVGDYFNSVTTDFKILNIISSGNKVVINGTAEFSRENKHVSFVSSCDIYEFNDFDQIQKITSYCIQG
jgi:SnoaL-like domain